MIDEFSALEGEHVLALLARARSARLGVVLSTQELSDLERVAPGFSDQVLGNTAVKVIHRQDVPESAERLASLAGTTKTWRETFQTDYQLQNAAEPAAPRRAQRPRHPQARRRVPRPPQPVQEPTHRPRHRDPQDPGVHATETLIIARRT